MTFVLKMIGRLLKWEPLVVADIIDFPTPTTLDDQVLDADNWSLVNDRYEYEFSHGDIVSTSVVMVVPLKTTLDIVRAAEIDPFTLSGSGTVTIYAVNEPTDDIDVQIIIMN